VEKGFHDFPGRNQIRRESNGKSLAKCIIAFFWKGPEFVVEGNENRARYFPVPRGGVDAKEKVIAGGKGESNARTTRPGGNSQRGNPNERRQKGHTSTFLRLHSRQEILLGSRRLGEGELNHRQRIKKGGARRNLGEPSRPFMTLSLKGVKNYSLLELKSVEQRKGCHKLHLRIYSEVTSDNSLIHVDGGTRGGKKATTRRPFFLELECEKRVTGRNTGIDGVGLTLPRKSKRS